MDLLIVLEKIIKYTVRYTKIKMYKPHKTNGQICRNKLKQLRNYTILEPFSFLDQNKIVMDAMDAMDKVEK